MKICVFGKKVHLHFVNEIFFRVWNGKSTLQTWRSGTKWEKGMQWGQLLKNKLNYLILQFFLVLVVYGFCPFTLVLSRCP